MFFRSLIGLLVLVSYASTLEAQERLPSNLEHAVLIYNNLPGSTYKIGFQMKPGPVPPRVIGIPASLVRVNLTRAEAGALIAAIGVYSTPDLREIRDPPLDLNERYDRLLRIFQSCPGALISAAYKVESAPGGYFAISLMNRVRTSSTKYVVPASSNCRDA